MVYRLHSYFNNSQHFLTYRARQSISLSQAKTNFRHVGKPKTEAGYRKIYLTPEFKDILRGSQKITIEQGIFNGAWIFVNKDSQRIITGTTDKYIRRV